MQRRVNRFVFLGKKIRIPTRGWAVQRARGGRQKRESTLLSGQPRRWAEMNSMKIDAFTDNLDIVSNTPLVVEASIEMIAEKDGGRHGPFTNDYSPNHNFEGASNSLFFIGRINTAANEWVYPGETKTLQVTFLNAKGLRDLLIPGRQWRIQEGHRLVGLGKVIRTIPEK